MFMYSSIFLLIFITFLDVNIPKVICAACSQYFSCGSCENRLNCSWSCGLSMCLISTTITNINVCTSTCLTTPYTPNPQPAKTNTTSPSTTSSGSSDSTSSIFSNALFSASLIVAFLVVSIFIVCCIVAIRIARRRRLFQAATTAAVNQGMPATSPNTHYPTGGPSANGVFSYVEIPKVYFFDQTEELPAHIHPTEITALQTKNANEGGLCIICLEKPCSVAFFPCHHVVSCVPCALHWEKTHKEKAYQSYTNDPTNWHSPEAVQCPLCRDHIQLMVRLIAPENETGLELYKVEEVSDMRAKMI